MLKNYLKYDESEHKRRIAVQDTHWLVKLTHNSDVAVANRRVGTYDEFPHPKVAHVQQCVHFLTSSIAVKHGD